LVKIGNSIRIKSEIIHWIDKKVKESIFASRTHAFEYAVKQLMKSERQHRG